LQMATIFLLSKVYVGKLHLKVSINLHFKTNSLSS
jgi:hypothetical protein